MNAEYWDALEVSLAEGVLAMRINARDAVVRACQDHPLATVPYLVLALSSMAAALEDEWLAGSLSQQQQLLEVYRAMIALSADLAVLDIGNFDRRTCNDLLTYWEESKDTFFVVTQG